MINKTLNYKLAASSLLLLSSSLAISLPANAGESGLTSKPSIQLNKMNVLYDYDEVFGFDIEAYLEKNAPHLVQHAETISHFAGRSSISPRVFIALMEQQTGILSRSDANDAEMAMPFGTMSQEFGFIEQMRDVSERIAEAFYKGHSYAETGKNQKFTTDADAVKAVQMIFSHGFPTTELQPGSKEQVESFTEIFFSLFPEEKNAKPEPSAPTTMSVPSSNLLAFPWRYGETWYIGGSHTNTGSGSYPQSSLDANNGGYWGSNLSNIVVAASAAGRVRVYSRCNMEVFHNGGWSTQYYHVDNIQYNTGSYVNKGTGISNYASNQNVALCEGGRSTGPHLHWSLKLNGQHYHLNGVTISGYTVNTGRNSYDTDCRYFYLYRNGSKYCAGRYTNRGSRRDAESIKFPEAQAAAKENDLDALSSK
ncbi:M23 family metallopeptidase [Aliikangiella maris]|uniref:M23 family metallopeptidase n=2 Tax=Aliikangiella maris TaxID=3162458 RepID=A0ABV2BWH1_9GAMM